MSVTNVQYYNGLFPPQAGEYPVVGAGVEPDYGQYVSSPAAHYNHMGHLTMAPSQKYPHVSCFPPYLLAYMV